MANSVSLVLLCVGLTATGVHAICDTVEMEKCVGDLATSSKNMESITFNLNREEFDEVCSVFDTVDKCARSQTDTCDPSLLVGWNALADAIAYLCSDTMKEVYLRNAHCISKTTTKTTQCDRTFAASKTVIYNGDTTSRCRIFNNRVSCKIGAIKDDCGTEIAEVLYQVTKKVLSFVYDDIGCTFDVTVANAFYASGSATKLDAFGGLLFILSYSMLALL